MLKLPHSQLRDRPLVASRRQAVLAWMWRRNRRRRALAHTEPEARPGREASPLRVGLLGFWALDGNAGTDEPELSGSMLVGALVCDYVEDADEIGSVVGPGVRSARSFSNTGALSVASPAAALAQLPLTLNFWAKFPAEFDASVGSLPWAWNCGEIWGPPFSAYHYGGAAYVTARDVDGGGVVTANFQTAYSDDAWHMWTIMLDADWSLSIYIDGVLCGDFELQEDYAPPMGSALQGEVMDSLSFGNSKYAGALNGNCGSGHAMALIGIWNRALTVGEIGQLFNGGDGLGFSEF